MINCNSCLFNNLIFVILTIIFLLILSANFPQVSVISKNFVFTQPLHKQNATQGRFSFLSSFTDLNSEFSFF